MAPDSRWLQDLLTTPDPLEVIWREMLSLWQAGEQVSGWSSANLVTFYDRQEEALSHLEELLYHGYFEIYDLLLERALQQNGEYVRKRLEGNAVVIIADSLSVREASLLPFRLGEEGWTVQVEGFAVASFPTATEPLARMLLGTAGPAGGRDTATFAYRYVTGPEQIPALPADRPVLVWLRLPDTALEEITVAQATTVATAFEGTVQTLVRVLSTVADRPVFLTSDHGYFYARSPAHYWLLPTGVEEATRRYFPRGSRFQSLTEKEGQDLLHYEPKTPEGRFFAVSKGYLGLRGRYWWAGKSPNDRCTAHGGLSLAEALVPILSLRREFQRYRA